MSKNYSFDTLSSFDFENFVADLLGQEFGLRFETFTIGTDGGIDFRYLCKDSEKGIIIGQVKHFPHAKFPVLYSNLKKEIPKVKILNPKKYLVVTSASLTPPNKKKIKDLFDPYIKSEDDIFGKEDLNRLLDIYPQIEKNNLKLWLSSSIVLEAIINSQVINRSNWALETFKNDIIKFVETKSFKESLKSIQKNNFVILSGHPGVGKSTIAKMIALNFKKEGYQIYDCTYNIDEVWKFTDDQRKNLFYVDDFLGSNILDKKPIEVRNIINIINKIRNSENKIVLNSRIKLIEDTNKYDHPILSNFKDSFIENSIDLNEKIMILHNSFKYSKIHKSYISKITQNNYFYSIVTHRNFNPRIIEFVTNPLNIENEKIATKNYVKWVLNKLDNPDSVWEVQFNCLRYEAKLFLITLFTFRSQISETNLKNAFEKRVEYECVNNNFHKPINCFHEAVRELNKSFIKISTNLNETLYDFCDPSVSDYIYNILIKNHAERIAIYNSISFVEQFDCFDPEDINRETDEINCICGTIMINHKNYKSLKNNKYYELLSFLNYFFDNSELPKVNQIMELTVKEYLQNIKFEKFDPELFNLLIKRISCENKEITALLNTKSSIIVEKYIEATDFFMFNMEHLEALKANNSFIREGIKQLIIKKNVKIKWILIKKFITSSSVILLIQKKMDQSHDNKILTHTDIEDHVNDFILNIKNSINIDITQEDKQIIIFNIINNVDTMGTDYIDNIFNINRKHEAVTLPLNLEKLI